jgi:glycosyltransferase involved in cell wall biosynthesis
MMAKRVVVAGSLAQKPRRGGHSWVFLQYLLGFRRLGWDVLFLDRLEPEMCRDASGQRCSLDLSLNLRYFLEAMERFGLEGKFALLYRQGEQCIGLSRQQVLERTRDAALLLNVMGFLTDEEILERAPQRVFLDIDPGFGQMWQDAGLTNIFQGHDQYVTIGQNIGRPGCPIPACGLPWITTPQPVVLEHWQPAPSPAGACITSIASWRGAYGPVEYKGHTYGLRVHEFRKFSALPRQCARPFELALDIDPGETKDLALLKENGWSLVDPGLVAGDPGAYQAYIQGSWAEFTVAKNIYVQTGSGWFSDRSICYLASGKPVIAQDTGFAGLYPTGEGLLAFRTFEEAVAAVAELSRNYDRHARAARAVAEAYFDSDKVLGRLLGKLGVA